MSLGCAFHSHLTPNTFFADTGPMRSSLTKWITGVGAILVLGSCRAASPAIGVLSPPQITYQSPFRVFRYITELSAIHVEFGEPVAGVRARDLTVNGAPATRVEGVGKGPYLFSGFAVPGPGPVTVRVASGSITDRDGNRFEGSTWSHVLIDPDLDLDGDGVRDGDEALVHLTDPTVTDTDGDGLPDGFEIAHGCLDPLADERHPHDFTGAPLPGDDDADDDGYTNAEELYLGSDPCSAESP